MSGTTSATAGLPTLLLDRGTWDLCLDAKGNMAVATAPYAIVQDVASACRLFLGELWYDTTAGVPYWQNILGAAPSVPYIKAALTTAALTVPGVISAQVFVSGFVNRVILGQVQITDVTGEHYTVPLGN